MSADGTGADDRWQDLLRTMDPVSNLNALADVWRQAVAASERVVGATIGPNGTATGGADGAAGTGPRDLRLDFERSVDQMADAAKRFFAGMPWAGPSRDTPARSASVAVVDGVGTTEIAGPPGEGDLWSSGAVSHDGVALPPSAVTIRATPDYGTDGEVAGQGRSFIVKVAVGAETPSGLYHGLVLCQGDAGFVVPLEVKVVGAER
jgi:hypothetical protein